MEYTSKCALGNVRIIVGSADRTTRLEADVSLGAGCGRWRVWREIESKKNAGQPSPT
jgi:hypothetical protein